MTENEFNNEFDVEYNNVTSNMAPGLDEYEKSKFLTTAQQEIVTQLYSGNSLGEGFESSELNRRYLANLIRQQVVNTTTLTPKVVGAFSFYTITLDSKVFVILSEQVFVENSDCCGQLKLVNVVPTKYDEVNKVLNNPFRRPNNNKALRVDKSSTEVEIISKRRVTQYSCEYLKKPAPIVLTNLPSTLSIDGVTTPQTSELDPSLHRIILKYAVQLAAVSWASNNKS